MPFTQSVGPYQGGNYLFQGLSSVGDKAAEAIKMLDENRKLDAYNDTVVQHAFQNNQMSREDYDKYVGSSRTAKTGIAAGLAANFVENMQAEQLKSAVEARKASIENRQASITLRQQQQQALNWQPTQQDLEQARWTGNELIRTGPGKFQPVPYGDTGGGQDAVLTDPLVISGQTIPGIGVNRKTGQYVYFGGTRDTAIDPVTGAPFNVDPKGNRKYQNAQTIMGGQMIPQATPAPTPGRFDRAWNWITGGGQQAPATPAPSQTPTPPDQAQEAVPVTAQPTAKADPRAEAMAYLQAHGLPVTEANIKHYIDASKSK